jgi:hypothetical protein
MAQKVENDAMRKSLHNIRVAHKRSVKCDLFIRMPDKEVGFDNPKLMQLSLL